MRPECVSEQASASSALHLDRKRSVAFEVLAVGSVVLAASIYAIGIPSILTIASAFVCRDIPGFTR
jgi:hypothetical protein